MRRVRTSTWILTAVFLVALVTYVLVRPAPTATVGNPSTTVQPSTSPRADPDDVTANHLSDADSEAHANEFGVPD